MLLPPIQPGTTELFLDGSGYHWKQQYLQPLLLCSSSSPALSQQRNKPTITFSQKPNNQQNPNPKFNLPIKFLTQSAIAVLGLGFIDAGYSGDWSRIGVISSQDEDLLKTAAFVAVPLCLGLIVYLSRENES